MSSRSTIRLLFGLVICTSCSLTFLVGVDFEHWLNEEVRWIISKSEQEEFENLESVEALEDFIARFWLRRDPTPSTLRNEYKEEHYRRLMYAQKAYREGMPGWKTDRGRVYILHGPPASERFFRSRSTIHRPQEATHTERNPNTILWTYHQLPNAKYYKGELRLVFQPSSGMGRQNFALSESITAQQRASRLSQKFGLAVDPNLMEADVRYRLVMAGPPGIVNASGADLPTAGVGETKRYIDDVLRSPGELLEERELEHRRQEAVQNELRELVATKVAFGQVRFELACQALYRAGQEWLIPLRAEFPLDQLENQKLDLYAALYDDQGRLFDEFIDSLQFDRGSLLENGTNSVFYCNSFSAPAGRYSLKLVLREVESERTGLREESLNLKEVRPPQLEISALVLTNRAELLPDEAPEIDEETSSSTFLGSSIVFNQARLLPNPAQRFRPEDYLLLYMQLWVPEAQHKISVNANFIREGEIVKRLEPRFLEDSGDACLEYGTAVPLEGFEPGDYIVQIQAVDHTKRTFDIHRASFAVLASILQTVEPEQTATEQ